jgi:hypothetical protein
VDGEPRISVDARIGECFAVARRSFLGGREVVRSHDLDDPPVALLDQVLGQQLAARRSPRLKTRRGSGWA